MHHDHELEGKGVRAIAFKANQGDAARVDGLVKAVVRRFGSLDILVNTAGVFVTGSNAGCDRGRDSWSGKPPGADVHPLGDIDGGIAGDERASAERHLLQRDATLPRQVAWEGVRQRVGGRH